MGDMGGYVKSENNVTLYCEPIFNATISAFCCRSKDVDTHPATLACADAPHPQIVIGSCVSSTAGVVSGDDTFDTSVTETASRALRVKSEAAYSCSLPTRANGSLL